MSVLIRSATGGDLEAINDIYNHYVLHSTCTFQTVPEPMEGRRAWFEQRGAQHPVIVAEEAGVVIGWGSLSVFNNRCAYRSTVEDSVYLRHDRLGRGIGKLVLGDLIARAEGLGHHCIMGLMAADQPASHALHARMGFEQVGRLREVGYKYERWIDVIYMQRMLRG